MWRLNAASQRGHFGIFPHSSHWSMGEYDLRSRRIATWPPLSRHSRILSMSFLEKLPIIPFFFRSAMVSIISTSESEAWKYLAVRSIRPYLPTWQL